MTKLKNVLVLCVLMLTLTLTVEAQKTVFQDLTWEQAAQLAEKEGKIIMVDAMMKPRTSEQKKAMDKMQQDIFKASGVTDFCKKNVIAIQIDMGSEAGKEFAPKLVMNMYPTYGFFMPNGDILGTVSPFLLIKDPQLLVQRGEKAVEAAAVKRSNNRSITFEEMTLEEAMKKSAKENKLIFIDAYTDYCQPCVLMVKNVFSLNKVADFYNQNFINLKINFSKETKLAEKFGTSGYPSFIFVNKDGKMVHLAGGYTEPDEFIGYGEEALKKAKGIEFTQGNWQQVLDKAKKENKLIFMDCYTSWCGPCKMLAKDVFTDPDVATVFNDKFVNVKVDMEKGEGKMLKDRYEVSAYPTLNFINGNGELVHCVVGGVNAETLIKQAGLAQDGKGLAYVKTQYQKGERSPEFIENFLNMLDLANQAKEAEKVCIDYFANLDKSKLKEKKYWDLFVKYVSDVNSDVFAYVYENRDELSSLLGEKAVKGKIRTVWAIGANRFVSGRGEEAVLDKKGFNRYIKQLAKADVEGNYEIIADAKMANAEKLGDWKTYLKLGDEKLKAGKVSDLVLYNWGLRISKQCQDIAMRLQAAKWFDDAAAASAKREAEGKSGMMSYKVYFEKLAAELKQAPKAA